MRRRRIEDMAPQAIARERRRRRAEHEHLADPELLRAANQSAAQHERNLEKKRRAEAQDRINRRTQPR